MQVTDLLTRLQKAGFQLIPEGSHIRVKVKLTDELRQAIRQHKPALLALLRETPSCQVCGTPSCQTAHVGRWAEAPCPECGDRWLWPTTSGQWVCAWCFVRDGAGVKKTEAARHSCEVLPCQTHAPVN